MKFGNLRDVTGRFAEDSVKWLEKEQMGCCSVCFATDDKYNYAVCIGWHRCDDERKPDGTYGEVWKIAWKVGRQTTNNVLQCDFDVDFEMPYDPETGDVDDTLDTIEVTDGLPAGYRSWAALAAHMREEARRVWNDWKEATVP